MTPDYQKYKDDFQYWAEHAVVIRDKKTGRDIPFVLNRAQRRVLAIMESMRTQGRPIRLIMLKSRQWGGSTLIQVYMAWIQLMHRENWHSVICAHVKDSAKNIRGMYTKLLANYPDHLTASGDEKPVFAPFERSENVRIIRGRNCRVAVTSAEAQDNMRGTDISMVHLSEVAFFKSTTTRDPEDFLRAVCGSVPLEPYTLVAIESTANGVGNFFHNEWLRAERGESDKVPVFVPWYEIEIYSMPVDNPEAFRRSLNAYETALLEQHGCSLEQINWYRHKRAEFPKDELMHAEFPTTPAEAFTSSDSNVFDNRHIERMRLSCAEPRRGEISADDTFVEVPDGSLALWKDVEPDTEYITVVDVGGRSRSSDWSVAAVLRLDTVPEVVAQWRGHIDHDLLARKAIALSRHYGDALLVIESNTLESAGTFNESSSVLAYVQREYDNIYYRRRDETGVRIPHRIGFHTNVHTKSHAIDLLIAAVRDGSYIERDTMACNELATYCRQSNGACCARPGCHDDILMTRAIALAVFFETYPDGYYTVTHASNLPKPSPFW